MSVTSYYQERINQNNTYCDDKKAEIETMENTISSNKALMKNLQSKINKYFASWGVSNFSECNAFQRTTISKLMSNITDLKFNNIALNNNIYSSHLSIFNTTIDNSYLCNDLMIAKHFENNA